MGAGEQGEYDDANAGWEASPSQCSHQASLKLGKELELELADRETTLVVLDFLGGFWMDSRKFRPLAAPGRSGQWPLLSTF